MQQQGRDPALLDMDTQRLDAHRDVVMARTPDPQPVKVVRRACPIAPVALLVPVASASSHCWSLPARRTT